MLQLCQLLVDRKVFKFVILLYHEQEHSKVRKRIFCAILYSK